MSERVTLKRKTYMAKDGETGNMVEFGEQTPIGESGKEYHKFYVSNPKGGGWYAADKETGQVVSSNAVIGYSDYEGMDDHARKSASVNFSPCPVCHEIFKNEYFLSLHTEKAHGKGASDLKEEVLMQEEETVQAKLAEKSSVPQGPVTPPVGPRLVRSRR